MPEASQVEGDVVIMGVLSSTADSKGKIAAQAHQYRCVWVSLHECSVWLGLIFFAVSQGSLLIIKAVSRKD